MLLGFCPLLNPSATKARKEPFRLFCGEGNDFVSYLYTIQGASVAPQKVPERSDSSGFRLNQEMAPGSVRCQGLQKLM